jgi:uncharacterized protein (DUF1330 family)
MSYYFLANIEITDKKEYERYINHVDEVFSKFNGKYLAVDDNPQIIEGSWNYTRSVLIEFQTKKDFNDWYNSKEYQKILKNRLNSANCDTILIKGK